MENKNELVFNDSQPTFYLNLAKMERNLKYLPLF